MNGKGDKRRPMAIDKETYDERWERIFGKGKELKGNKYFEAPAEYWPGGSKDRNKK